MIQNQKAGPTSNDTQLAKGVSQNPIKKANNNIELQDLKTLVQVAPSKKYYTGAEVPFSSGKYRALKPKHIKMGEFSSFNRPSKRQAHNSSYLTDQSNSKEVSYFRNSGLHRQSVQGSIASHTERRRIEPSDMHYRGKTEDKHALTDTEEPKSNSVGFKLHSRVPRLVPEVEEGDRLYPAGYQIESKRNKQIADAEVEDSDGEIKFPFRKGEKGKKVDFHKMPASQKQKGKIA